MGNDCTWNCSSGGLKELFHLVRELFGLSAQLMMEGVPGEARTPGVCFGSRPPELPFLSGVLSTSLLYDALCVPFPGSTVQPVPPARARAHFLPYELRAPAKNWSVQC